MALGEQHVGQHLAHVRLVVHHQDAAVALAVVGGGRARCLHRRGRGHPEDHRRPAPLAAVQGDVAAVAAHEAVGDGETEPEPAHALRGEERLEGTPAHVLRHAGPGVGDRDHRPARLAPGADGDAAAPRHGVHRVQDQVGDHLAELRVAARDRRQGARLEGQLDPRPAHLGLVLPARAGQVDGLAHGRVQVERRRAGAVPGAAEGLDAPHRVRGVQGRALDGAQRRAVFRIAVAVEQELGAPQHHRHQVVQVVRGAGGQLADRAQGGAAHQRVLGGLQLVESPSQIADETRVVHGQRGLAAEGGQGGLVAAVEGPRVATEGAEGRDRLPARVGDRHREQAHDLLVPRPPREGGRLPEAGISLPVVAPQRALVPQQHRGRPVAGLEAQRGLAARPRPRVGGNRQGTGGRIDPQAHRAVGVQQGRDLADHRLQHRGEIGRGEGLGGHALKRLDLGQPPHGVRVQARVADGERGGGGEGLGERHLRRGELVPLAGHAGQDPAHRVVEQDRHAEQRDEALRLEPGALLEPRVLLHLGHAERLAVGEHPAHERGAGGHVLPGRQRGPDPAPVGGQAQDLARVVQQPDACDVGLEAAVGDLGEAIEDFRQIERRGEQPARLREDFNLLRARIDHRVGWNCIIAHPGALSPEPWRP